jgi:outer membrane protein OmpA-like peptidoglycan-associated protein
MIKYRHLFIFLFLIGQNAIAQQDVYQWRMGIQGGAMHYYGDLNKRFFPKSPLLQNRDWNYLSYGASIEKFLSDSWAIKLNYWNGKSIANDIFTDQNQTIIIDKSNFTRALNAQTQLQALNFQFTYYFDNGKWRSNRAFISPYFTAGIGLVDFKVYADLQDAGGNRYHYWSDNTIRNQAENNPAGQIIRQDGNFETYLSDLQTEGKAYSTRVLQIPLGIGLKFRLSNRLNLNLEMLANYTFTDYLEDVSGNYLTQFSSEIQQIAANPSNSNQVNRGRENDPWNDIYAFTSLGLHYNWGAKKTNFKAPKIFASNNEPTFNAPIIIQKTDTLTNPLTEKDSLVIRRDTLKISPLAPHLVYTQPFQRNLVIGQDSIWLQSNDSSSKPLIPPSQSWYFQPIDTLVQFTSTDKPLLNNQLADNSLVQNPSQNPALIPNSSPTETQDLSKTLNEIAYLEFQIKKKKLENELQALQNPPINNLENKTANQLTVSSLNAKKDSLIQHLNSNSSIQLTEAQNYALQERLRLEKEKQAFYLEQLSALKRANEANQNRLNATVAVPLATNVNPNQTPQKPDNQKFSPSDSLIKAQNIKVDSLAIRQQIRQTLAPDSLLQTHPAWESVSQKIDQLALQMAVEKQTQANAQSNQQLLNEIQTLKNQVLSLQNQLNKPSLVSPPPTRLLTNYEVYFASGLMEIDALQRSKLATIIQQIRASNANCTFVLQGYSDKFGNAAQNMSLSKLRAEKVRDLLLAFGVPWSAIQVEYYGSNHAGNLTNPALDRRVELRVIGN